MSAQSRQWKFARSVSDLLALIDTDGGALETLFLDTRQRVG
jgi:hypothetical protein